MNCPICGGRTRVVDCRSESDKVYRRRRCVECEYLTHTTEASSEESRIALNRLQSEQKRQNLLKRLRLKSEDKA